MGPDSENNIGQNQSTDPKNDIPVSASPGGVIRPSGSEAPVPPRPAQNPVPPETQNIQPTGLSAPAAASSPPQPTAPSPPSGPGPSGTEIFPPDPNRPTVLRGRFSKKLLLAIGAPILLVLLGAGYVFGFYIPNKPENVYKTGLDRSGDALQVIVDKATEQQTYDKFKTSEIAATIDVNSSGQNIKGDFRAKFDDSSLDSELKANFPISDSQRADLGFSLLSEKAEGKELPDIYFNLKGVKALGADLFLPGISKYDGKWVAVTSEYLQSLADQYGIQLNKENNSENYPTFDEISTLIRDVYKVTNEYVLTSDPSKAVFENRQYLGKEDVEGVGAFHYEVGINKGNFKNYCEAVSNVLIQSSAAKKFMNLSDEQAEQEKQKIGENCQADTDSIKDDHTFEMWVDSKYKLIKKIRVYYSKEDKGEYYEFGQNYDGSDKVSLFFATVSNKDGFNSKTAFTTDLNSGESSGELTFNGGSDPSKYDGKFTLSAKPLGGEFEVTKPSGATSVDKLLKDIGINPKDFASFYGSTAGDSQGSGDEGQDALIKSNVNRIYAQLEVYYAENAYYPTKTQFDNSQWRSANLQGLNQDALEGVTYAPFECSSSNCQKYNLRAKLENGETFVKISSA